MRRVCRGASRRLAEDTAVRNCGPCPHQQRTPARTSGGSEWPEARRTPGGGGPGPRQRARRGSSTPPVAGPRSLPGVGPCVHLRTGLISQVACLVEPGALLFAGMPSGPEDEVWWNAHRVSPPPASTRHNAGRRLAARTRVPGKACSARFTWSRAGHSPRGSTRAFRTPGGVAAGGAFTDPKGFRRGFSS